MEIKDNLSLRHYVVAFTSDKLSRFLIKEGIYDRFITNCVNYVIRESAGSKLNMRAFKKVYTRIDGELRISTLNWAFTWSETPEGRVYWHDMWRKFSGLGSIFTSYLYKFINN